MKKPIVALLTLLIALTLPFSVTAASTPAEDPATPLRVEIATNRNTYSTLGVATVTVTVTNTSQSEVERVSAEFLGGQLAALGGNSAITGERDSLTPGESFRFTFKATLNKDAVALSGSQRLGLGFVRLWYKNMPVVDNGFDNGRAFFDTSRTLKFGQLFAACTVRVWYVDDEIPTPGDTAEILAYYNAHANAMKVFQGTVTVTKRDGTTSKINAITGGSTIQNYAEGLLPNDYRAKPTLTFVNGMGGSRTLASYLPRNDSNFMSELNPSGPNGVKWAATEDLAGGRKVTIALNDDLTTGPTALRDKPTYVSLCMDTLDLTADDLKPFTLESAVVNYTGCKIVAVFDAQNRMTKLDITTPVNIVGTLKYGVVGVTFDITGTYNGNYTFAYAT